VSGCETLKKTRLEGLVKTQRIWTANFWKGQTWDWTQATSSHHCYHQDLKAL